MNAPSLRTLQLVQNSTVRTEKLDLQRHLPQSMCRTAQAGVVRTNDGFYAVQHAVIEPFALHVALRDLKYAAIHRQVVLPGRNDQIGPADQSLLIDFVVMKERAARCFCRCCAFQRVGARDGTHVLGENFWIGEKLFNPFDAVENFDQPGLMIIERAQHRVLLDLPELCQFLISERSATVAAHIEPGERPDAIGAARQSSRYIVGRLQIAPRLDLFAEVLEIAGWIEIFGDSFSRLVDDPQRAIVERKASVFFDETHKERGEVAKCLYLIAESRGCFLQPRKTARRDGHCLGNRCKNCIAILYAQRLADAAGYYPGRMNALASQAFDDLLAEFP